MTPTTPAAWAVVVPVKGGAGAKSRLARSRGGPDPVLALALAQDCLEAVLTVRPALEVVVVTADEQVAGWARDAGAAVAADPGGGLDAAVRAGARHLLDGSLDGHAAGSPPGVAVLLGDLPALRPGDLAEALAACAAHPRAVVPDAEGTGTVLLTARDAAGLAPSFGAGSAARHEGLGHTRLDLDLPRLRTDVDDAASLRRALALGVGRHTLRALGPSRRESPAAG